MLEETRTNIFNTLIFKEIYTFYSKNIF